MRLTVVGLDGACWKLLKPWIKEGSLPNIEEIMKHGVWGDMESCLPPVSLPNWKCYSTGKNPGKIGIFWWENINFERQSIYHPFSRKFRNTEIWDYLSDVGKRVGVIGVPGTYPPRKVNGFIISGGPDAERTGFTYPKELEGTLTKDYRVINLAQTSWNFALTDETAAEIQSLIDNQFKVAKALAKRYCLDFLQITVFSVNIMHHFFWDNVKTKKCWEIIDKHIGDILGYSKNTILMSDHGSNKIRTVFHMNSWLENQGYLILHRKHPSMSQILFRVGRTFESLSLKLRLRKMRNLVDKIPNNFREETKSSLINWQKSRAVATGQGPIYLNVVDKSERKKLEKEITEKLEALVDPKEKVKVVRKVYSKNEVYSGKYFKEAPDLIADQGIGVHILGDFEKRRVFAEPRKWRGENTKTGLFAAYGDDIKSGIKIKRVSIVDLAPTILHMFNIPVPKDMDGKVLTEIFDEHKCRFLSFELRQKS